MGYKYYCIYGGVSSSGKYLNDIQFLNTGKHFINNIYLNFIKNNFIVLFLIKIIKEKNVWE